VVDCLRHWSERAELPLTQLLAWLGIPSSKYYAWCQRYGRPNGHNAQVPRYFWLLPTERQAILDYQAEHPQEGYRRLCYMMLDAGVVAVSPASVYRVLKGAGRMSTGISISRISISVGPSTIYAPFLMDIVAISYIGRFVRR